jgi:hypothetical protein
LTEADELNAAMAEAARHRELDRLLKISVSRDGFPLAWRRALRLILLISLVDGCEAGEAGALPLLTMHLNAMRSASRRSSPAKQRAGGMGLVAQLDVPTGSFE